MVLESNGYYCGQHSLRSKKGHSILGQKIRDFGRKHVEVENLNILRLDMLPEELFCHLVENFLNLNSVLKS